MASVIQWFLVEIERRLGADVSPDRVFQLQLEAGAHLQETADELESKGMGRSEAERAAVVKFGSPRSFRTAVLRQLEGRFLGLPTAAWCVAIGALAVLSNLCWNYAVGMGPFASFMLAMSITGLVSLVLYGVLCFRLGRNPLLLSLLIAAIGIPPFLFFFGMTFARIQNQLVAKADLGAISDQIKLVDARTKSDLQLIEEGTTWASQVNNKGQWDQSDFRLQSPRFKEHWHEYLSPYGLSRSQGSNAPNSWLAPIGFTYMSSLNSRYPGYLNTPVLRMRAYDNPNSAAYMWREFQRNNEYELRILATSQNNAAAQLEEVERARTHGFDASVIDLSRLYQSFSMLAMVLAVVGQTGSALRSIVSRLRNRVGFA